MRVVGYCRYSSENQRDGHSIEAQKRAIIDYCNHEGLTLVDFYIDEARTGTTDNRESFQNMIYDCGLNKFEAVVVHKLDRFSRDRYDSAIYKKKLRDSGVRLISVTEPLDDSPESVMMEAVIEGMSEYYSKNLSREVLKGKTEAARGGQFNGGLVPYGFSVGPDRRFEVVPEEAEIVRTIFQKVDEGLSFRAVVRYLNANGIKNKRTGRNFNDHTISRFIKNPLYKGVLVYGTRSRTGLKDDPIILEDAVEPIVDSELFDRLNEQYRNRAVKYREAVGNRKKKADVYFLTGLAMCGCCGSHLKGFRSRKKYKTVSGEERLYSQNFYRCARKVPRTHVDTGRTKACEFKNFKKDELERFVVLAVEHIIFSDDSLRLIVDKIKSRLIERLNSQDDVTSARRELQNIKMQQERLLDLYLSGSIDIPTFNSRKEELAAQFDFYTEKVASSRKRINPDAITFDFVRGAISRFRSKASADSEEYKRLLVWTYVQSIVLDNENITIYFKFPLPGLEDGDVFVSRRTTVSTCATPGTELPTIKVDYTLAAVLALDLHSYEMSVV